MKISLYFALICFPLVSHGQVLFDATKAEMAGNADWVIDADAHDLRVQNGDGSGVRGLSNESDPQRIPTPSITGITSTTSENYWQGALSSWAVALAKAGVTSIETLPVFISPTSNTRSRITYNDASNPQDLSQYRLYVVCEPNIAFTAAEKTAILNYVYHGGRLFMVADHAQSDRNGDGIDSVGVWNDLLGATSVFGFKFNLDNVSPTGVADASASDPVTHGPAGTVTAFKYFNGCTMTITDPTIAHAAVWETSSHLSNQVMALYGTYGAGKFVAVGDSSPIDDGTGDPGDTLFDGWDDANGDDGRLVMDASLWLLQVPAMQLVGAVSRKTHGAAGTFDIALPLSGTAGIESRAGGTGNTHALVFSFTNDIMSGNASVTSGTASISGGPVIAANTVTVNLTGVANAQTITVTLSNVTDNFSQVLPNTALNASFLLGDTTANGTVNASDIALTKSVSGQTADATNFRNDVNLSGSISASDIGLVKSTAGTALPP